MMCQKNREGWFGMATGGINPTHFEFLPLPSHQEVYCNSASDWIRNNTKDGDCSKYIWLDPVMERDIFVYDRDNKGNKISFRKIWQWSWIPGIPSRTVWLGLPSIWSEWCLGPRRWTLCQSSSCPHLHSVSVRKEEVSFPGENELVLFLVF